MASILGIDSGLTVTKAVIFDIDGRVLSVARRRIPQIIPKPRHVERDMELMWAATAEAIREAVDGMGRPAGDIIAIAATAHGDGIYLLDRHNQPLGPAILSLDTRAIDIADQWNDGETAERSLSLTGQHPHASAPSAILRWIKDDEPERFSGIAHFMAAKDWLRYRLCGTIGTDRTEASTSFTDVQSQNYSEAAFTLFGLEALWDKRPPIASSVDVVGTVTGPTARQTGLLEGTPVVAGLHDVTASALGIGGYREGVVAIVAGTYSINETVSYRPEVDARWFCRNGIMPGEWNNMSISPASTANYDWFIERLCAEEAKAAEQAGESVHALIAQELAMSANAAGVIFHPYLFGSPFAGASSAGFFGLNAWHDRSDIIRAIIEGIAFNHRIHVDALRDGFSPGTARLTGGISRNPMIAGLFADILGMPVAATKTEEAAAWGAALCAGAGMGVYTAPTDDPRDLSEIETLHEPDPERCAAYETKYQVFLELAEAMKPVWPKLQKLASSASDGMK
ncbi:carbohydrate kinase [Paramesorhizobium deserti]|uniref:Carbohydrate kinase n=1 Tax=Paramesorhizobium deserti TaxID=1494590 RepID=A0A135HRI3_9HYPH|nr:FGGY-family carbohydrate kinase [Paramesorhizobium deserti]KXF75772.1 carbohydrate kinase [Paramesorhizobium deserti]